MSKTLPSFQIKIFRMAYYAENSYRIDDPNETNDHKYSEPGE
ncbi:MAG: hypothetical protein ACXAB7_03615 [Candidatus Kariarchaeaceae archaeon]